MVDWSNKKEMISFKNNISILILSFVIHFASPILAQRGKGVTVVDINGNGDFKSLQAAINSLSDSSSTTRTIYIKNGTYNEKIFIEKHNIIFEGEDRDK